MASDDTTPMPRPGRKKTPGRQAKTGSTKSKTSRKTAGSARKPGRRHTLDLDPQVTTRILSAVRAGTPLHAAAASAGIHPATLHRWLADAEKPRARQELVELRQSMDRARAECHVGMVATIARAAKGGALIKRTTRRYRDGSEDVEETFSPPDGRVALEFLSRAFPADWARRAPVAVELSGPDGGPMQVQQSRYDAIADKVAAALEAISPEPVDAELVTEESLQPDHYPAYHGTHAGERPADPERG